MFSCEHLGPILWHCLSWKSALTAHSTMCFTVFHNMIMISSPFKSYYFSAFQFSQVIGTKLIGNILFLKDPNPCLSNSSLCSQTGQYCLHNSSAPFYHCRCNASQGFLQQADGSCNCELSFNLLKCFN